MQQKRFILRSYEILRERKDVLEKLIDQAYDLNNPPEIRYFYIDLMKILFKKGESLAFSNLMQKNLCFCDQFLEEFIKENEEFYDELDSEIIEFLENF